MDNLLSGLLGAVLGVAISLVIYLADRNHTGRSAIRAVFVEALTNELFLEVLAEDATVAGPISNTIYLANMAVLAGALSRDDMTIVGGAYMFVPYCERLRTDLVGGRPLTEANRNLLASTHRSFIEASAVLDHRSYRRSGRRGKASLRTVK